MGCHDQAAVSMDSVPGNQAINFTSRLFSNSIYLILNSGIGAGLGFFFWLIAARLTTADQVGIASALISAAGLLSFFGSLGLGYGIIRFLPSSKAPVRFINNALTMAAAATVLISTIFILGLPLWHPTLAEFNRNPAFSAAFILLTAVLALMGITSQVFVSYREAKHSASQTLIFGTTKIVLVIGLILLFRGFGIFLSWGLGAALAVGVGLFLFLPKLQPGYHLFADFSPNNRTFYTFSVVNAVAEGLWNLPAWLLPLIITRQLGTDVNAYYYVSLSLAGLLFAIPMSISLSLFTEGSRDGSYLSRSLAKGAKLALFLVLPALFLEILLGWHLLSLFGLEYAEAGTGLLWILAGSVLPLTVNTFYITIMRVRQKLWEIILLVSVLAGLTLTICFILLPHTGIIGAGIGWAAAHTALCFYTLPKLAGIWLHRSKCT